MMDEEKFRAARECDHQGLDEGPCNCYDHKRQMPKTDRCSRCCGKCNGIYKVWIDGANIRVRRVDRILVKPTLEKQREQH